MMRNGVTAGLALLLMAGAAQAQSQSALQTRRLPPLQAGTLNASSFDVRGFDPLGLPAPAAQSAQAAGTAAQPSASRGGKQVLAINAPRDGLTR
jgi:hypothetical protein